ncbi:hypothetical protein Pcinc_000816 [Petrolisthes cinctipes]|uniref:L1 transposable element RRM domain-containing protein n=1 Tax=Petrolisthes cinctipes TaxID=88211 RepID=A0AAE1GPF8_PETCI|nr:hypothetical protein Pcinc_021170 [Petrolisthes cinctipes]KAK3895474.1 hypothetical protein Pcinc_000816 [Petrolisthes cinctipes]
MDPVVLKTLLESQQTAYKDSIDILVNQFNSRVASLEDKITDVVKSLEFSQKEIDDLKKEIMEVNKDKEEDKKRISELVVRNVTLSDQVVSLEKRFNYQEDYNRHNNLRISGVQERDDETWVQTLDIVKSLLQNKLQLPELNIERAHRWGMRQGDTPRSITVRFTHYSDRETVIRNARKLKVNRTSTEKLEEDNEVVGERPTADLSQTLTRGRGVEFGAFLTDMRSRRGSVVNGNDGSEAATITTRGAGAATSSSEPSCATGMTEKIAKRRKK